jgi:hypothetical protein
MEYAFVCWDAYLEVKAKGAASKHEIASMVADIVSHPK